MTILLRWLKKKPIWWLLQSVKRKRSSGNTLSSILILQIKWKIVPSNIHILTYVCAYRWSMYLDKLETRELRLRDTPKQLLPGQESTRGIHL